MRLGKSRNQGTRVGKVEIRGHALGSEERVSEAEPSSSLLIPGFSVFPVFGRFANRTAPPQIQISYPKATSSTIMITNPTATPTVLILECSPVCASGISSSTTT